VSLWRIPIVIRIRVPSLLRHVEILVRVPPAGKVELAAPSLPLSLKHGFGRVASSFREHPLQHTLAGPYHQIPRRTCENKGGKESVAL